MTEQKRTCKHGGVRQKVIVFLALLVGVLAALFVWRKPKELPEEIIGSEMEDMTHPFTFYGERYTLEIPGSWEVCQKENFKVFEVPPGTEGFLRPKGNSKTWLLVQVIPLTTKELMGVSDKETVIGLLRRYCLLGDDSKQIFWHYEKYSDLELDDIMLLPTAAARNFCPWEWIFSHMRTTRLFSPRFSPRTGNSGPRTRHISLKSLHRRNTVKRFHKVAYCMEIISKLSLRCALT